MVQVGQRRGVGHTIEFKRQVPPAFIGRQAVTFAGLSNGALFQAQFSALFRLNDAHCGVVLNTPFNRWAAAETGGHGNGFIGRATPRTNRGALGR